MYTRAIVERMADALLRGSGLLALLRRLDHVDGHVLRVLVYHRVASPSRDSLNGDPNVISAIPEAFAGQMRLLVRYYAPIGWSDLETSLRTGRTLPRRAVLVTFDDGYVDFLTNAWPALKDYSVPAMLFVPTAYPGERRLFWWDELWQMFSRSAVPEVSLVGLGPVNLRAPGTRGAVVSTLRREMRPLRLDVIQRRMAELRLALDVTADPIPMVLGWDELRTLSREGVTIASHGRSHASMRSLTDQEMIDEIEGSQEDIERELGSAPRIIAYPFGHDDPRAAAVLKPRGFVAAFATGFGHTAIPPADPYSMARQSVNAGHSMSRVQLGLAGLYPRPLVRLSAMLRPRVS